MVYRSRMYRFEPFFDKLESIKLRNLKIGELGSCNVYVYQFHASFCLVMGGDTNTIYLGFCPGIINLNQEQFSLNEGAQSPDLYCLNMLQLIGFGLLYDKRPVADVRRCAPLRKVPLLLFCGDCAWCLRHSQL